MHRLGADNTTDLNMNVVYYETYLVHLTISCQGTSNNTNPSPDCIDHIRHSLQYVLRSIYYVHDISRQKK